MSATGTQQEFPTRGLNWGRMVRPAEPFGHDWYLLQFTGRRYNEITA